MGTALVTGDFDGDHHVDLAVGAPGSGRGKVFLFRGTAGSTLGSHGRLVAWKVLLPPAGVSQFGAALAAGDFDGDGVKDLAVGAPAAVAAPYGGSVSIYQHTMNPRTNKPIGLLFVRTLRADAGEGGDRFGAALAAGDFAASGHDDLAVGAPGRRVGAVGPTRAGVVVVFRGVAATLSSFQLSELDASAYGAGVAVAVDDFGAAPASGDLDLALGPYGGLTDELVIGAPQSGVGGAAYLYLGRQPRYVTFPPQPSLAAQQPLRPLLAGGFGAALALGNFDGATSGALELAVGAPDAGSTHTGNIFVYRGNAGSGSAYAVHLVQDLYAPSPLGQEHLGAVLSAGTEQRSGGDSLYAGVPNHGSGELLISPASRHHAGEREPARGHVPRSSSTPSRARRPPSAARWWWAASTTTTRAVS